MSKLKEFLEQHLEDSVSLDVETASDGSMIGFSMAFGPLYEHTKWFEASELEGITGMNRKFITHYGLYDAISFLQKGIQIRIEYDTYSAARIIFWDRNEGFSLIALSYEMFSFEWYSVENLLAKYKAKGMEDIPKKACIEKCRTDAQLTWKLAAKFRALADPNSKRGKLIEVESQMNHVLAHMRYRGFGFDKKYMGFIKKDINSHMKKLYSGMTKYIPDINLTSNDILVQQLFGKQGLRIKSTDMPTTPVSGRVSVSAEMFEKFSDRHPILKLIAEYKRLDKLLNTYTDSYAQYAEADGRIHSKLDSFGANTGRLISSHPNMQNIPKTAEGKIIRKAFVSAPGYTLVDIDYSQIQLVILAVFSHDKNLMDIFRNGEDMHRKVAAVLYDISEDKVTAEQRTSVKPVNFGMVFGGGAWLFEPWAGKNEIKQREYQALWYSMFPGVKAFQDKYWSKQMQTRGYNETWYGRRRPLKKLYEGTGSERASLVRLLCNGDIQGTEGDLLKIGMVTAYNELKEPDAYMVLCVHDEIVFEVKDELLDSMIERLKIAMSSSDFPIPIKVSVSTGKNWYLMKERK